MNFSYRFLAAMLVLGPAAMPIQSLLAQTKVALHATQEEINIWNQRRVSGPYLDDWGRIINRANAFVASPRGEWLGNQQNQAWAGDAVKSCLRLPTVYPGGDSGNCYGADARGYGDYIRDAGFVYMLTGTTSYRDAVRTLLLTQISRPGADFTNITRWPTNYIAQDQDFDIGLWLRKMVYAYSYIRSSLTASERASIDAWFLHAATWLDTVVHNEVKLVFPNRLNDDYVTGAPSSASNLGLTHYNGNMTKDGQGSWDNKLSLLNSAVAAVAVVVNDATLKSHAKRFVKEWITYGTFPDGTVFDQVRWNLYSGGRPEPGLGYDYAATVIGSNIAAADHLARAGDTELYTFSTSSGLAAFGNIGGPKSLLGIMQRLVKMQQHLVDVYASTDSTLTECERIDDFIESASCPGFSTNRVIVDIALAQANVFYNDSLVKTTYARTLTTNPSNGGYDPYGGDWGNLPGVRFMFGQMEGKVSPYSVAPNGTALPAPPTALIVSP
jgi:hypothetical protein